VERRTRPLWCHGSVQFNHDNMPGVWLAEALVNLVAEHAWDVLAVQDLLDRYLFRHTDLDPATAHELREWVDRLRTVFDAPDKAGRCAAVNVLLAEGTRRVHLTTHDGMAPHLHFADTGDSLLERVRAVTAGGLAIFVVEAGGGRLGACARAGCRRVFADTSRNGRRTYCCARCGNADAVHRYRNRQHAPHHTPTTGPGS
jgi:predicted RNA-binding Zn ribbon-like protein